MRSRRWILPQPSLVFHKKPTFLASLPRSAWRDDLEITQAACRAPATVCKFRDERVITRRGGPGLRDGDDLPTETFHLAVRDPGRDAVGSLQEQQAQLALPFRFEIIDHVYLHMLLGPGGHRLGPEIQHEPHGVESVPHVFLEGRFEAELFEIDPVIARRPSLGTRLAARARIPRPQKWRTPAALPWQRQNSVSAATYLA